MTEVIDTNESVVNRYRYTPFGQSIVKEESVYNPYQYTGRRYDEERGNYYYRARIYDQQQSRFLSNDPAGQGANLYAYVGNITRNQVPGIEGNSTNFLLNPVNRRDPSGKIAMGGLGIGMRFVDGSGKVIGGSGGGSSGSGTDYTAGQDCPCAGYELFETCLDYHDRYGIMDGAYSDDEIWSYCIDSCYKTCMAQSHNDCEMACGHLQSLGLSFFGFVGIGSYTGAKTCPSICDALGY